MDVGGMPAPSGGAGMAKSAPGGADAPKGTFDALMVLVAQGDGVAEGLVPGNGGVEGFPAGRGRAAGRRVEDDALAGALGVTGAMDGRLMSIQIAGGADVQAFEALGGSHASALAAWAHRTPGAATGGAALQASIGANAQLAAIDAGIGAQPSTEQITALPVTIETLQAEAMESTDPLAARLARLLSQEASATELGGELLVDRERASAQVSLGGRPAGAATDSGPTAGIELEMPSVDGALEGAYADGEGEGDGAGEGELAEAAFDLVEEQLQEEAIAGPGGGFASAVEAASAGRDTAVAPITLGDIGGPRPIGTPASAATAHTPATLPQDVPEAEILRQISDGIRLDPDAEVRDLEIELNPATLGRVRLKMEVEGETVRVVLTAEHGAVRDLMAQSLDRLRQDLLAHGLQTEHLEVRQEAADRRGEGQERWQEGRDGELGDERDGRGAEQEAGLRAVRRRHAGQIDVTA